jgi:hypothetical protein
MPCVSSRGRRIDLCVHGGWGRPLSFPSPLEGISIDREVGFDDDRLHVRRRKGRLNEPVDDPSRI